MLNADNNADVTQNQDDDGFAFFEEYEEEEEAESQTGGSTNQPENDQDGGAPNATTKEYMWNRIRAHNPEYKDYKYTTLCPANVKRQPVVLTEKENDDIVEQFKNNPDKPYTVAMKYGKSVKNGESLYYTCPRYWCTKPGIEGPLSEQDVKDKKCGNIITNQNKDDEYTFDRGAKGNFEPGFVSGKKGEHLPCCFSLNQQKRWHLGNPTDYPPPDNAKPSTEIEATHAVQHTTQALMTKFPLQYGRIGFLPAAIETMLRGTRHVNRQNILEPNKPMLVRYGVSNNPQQSFLSCIADIYAYQHQTMVVESVSTIRNIIAKAIDLDRFVRLQNASLVAIFRPTEDSDEYPAFGPYIASDLYTRLNVKTDNSHRQFFGATVRSYENFIFYLTTTTATIDHTYLWEAVCQANPLLLPAGINLAILELPNADATDNVTILCPTNAYAHPLFDPEKRTLILMKQDAIYEPIYMYHIKQSNPNQDIRIQVQKTFMPTATNAAIENSDEMSKIVRLINMMAEQRCRPAINKSLNKTVAEMVEIFASTKETIDGNGDDLTKRHLPFVPVYQVSNYQNKCIALMVECRLKDPQSLYFNKKVTVYVPVFPSALLPTSVLPVVQMDNPTLWNKYQVTLDMLRYISTHNAQQCKPVSKVVEDGVLIGVITASDQFVGVRPTPYTELDDGLRVLHQSSPTDVDKILQLGTEKGTVHDKQMEKQMRNTRLQGQFYTAFRNTVRQAINLYSNRHIRAEIRDISVNRQLTFREKRAAVERALLKFGQLVAFHQYDDKVLDEIHDVHVCATDKRAYCAATASKTNGSQDLLTLVIPLESLTNPGSKNERMFYARVSDELVRYKAIQTYMFQTNALYLDGTVEYVVNPDETLLYGAVITDEYFAKLVPYTSQLASTTTFETAQSTNEATNPNIPWAIRLNELPIPANTRKKRATPPKGATRRIPRFIVLK